MDMLLIGLLIVLCLWALGQWFRSEDLQARNNELRDVIRRLNEDDDADNGTLDGCAELLLGLIVAMGVLILILNELRRI